MPAAQTPTGEWISQPRFDQAFGTTGPDHDFGMQWGSKQNQRISLRLAPGESDGQLYAYDPLWNEYNVLNASVSLAEARAAFDDVTRRLGYRGVGVDAFTDAVRQQQLQPRLAASVEPRTLGDLGIEL